MKIYLKTKTMKMINEFIANKKEECRKNHEDSIRNSFDITERGGIMWLTHNGVAFMKIASLSQAGDITKTLNEARACAVEFERL